jgi:hypothetical protein
MPWRRRFAQKNHQVIGLLYIFTASDKNATIPRRLQSAFILYDDAFFDVQLKRAEIRGERHFRFRISFGSRTAFSDDKCLFSALPPVLKLADYWPFGNLEKGNRACVAIFISCVAARSFV